jgi:signal transduction histidine kinase
LALAQRADAVVARAPRAPTVALVALAGAGAAAAVIGITLRIDETARVADAVLVGWVVAAYIGCGLIAWSRRPANRFGPLMIIAGFGPLLSRLAEVDASVLHDVGDICRLLPVVLFLHVFLAFPDGRLDQRSKRRLVAAGYGAVVGFAALALMLGAAEPASSIQIVSEPGAAHIVVGIGRIATAAVALAGMGLLLARRRSAWRGMRRSLVSTCFAFALVTLAVGVMWRHFHVQTAEPIKLVAFALIGVAPVLFLIGFLSARLARSDVADLFVELRADPGPADLRLALARALRDPSLELVYWLPQFGSYADLEGREVNLGALDAGRAVTLIDRGGSRVAALVHEKSLTDEPGLLDAVTAAAAMSLENGRLHAELRARLEELRGSRARILAAGQKERQRLERNLHDGAQQRLIALSLELSLLEAELEGDASATSRLAQARREIAVSLEELREVARGIHPAVVSGHGLEIALEQLVARAVVPVQLKVQVDGRLSEPLEVAAFYLVSESLANVAKHANATSASVEVAHADGRMVVEVMDDGIGGADTERGSGLRGLADRVEALEGQVRVWSPQGGGTRLRAEIPCAS